MRNDLIENQGLFPERCIEKLIELCGESDARFVVRRKRQSKLGDFRPAQKGKVAMITVNQDLNPYHFLIIFLHELAHLFVWNRYGNKVSAHGEEWKDEFSTLVQYFYMRNIFPLDLQKAIRGLIDNPKASSFADMALLQALRKYDSEENRVTLLDDLDEQALFRLNNGKVFRKLEKRRSRILCAEIGSRRKYLIHKLAEVQPVEDLL